MRRDFLSWWEALRFFMMSNHPALHWDRKVKGLFWFLVRPNWVVSIHHVLKQNGMVDVGRVLPYLYYMHRLESFVQHGEGLKQRLERVKCHLIALKKHFDCEQIQSIFGNGLTIYEDVLDGKKVEVVLRYEHGMRHEGLFSLILFIDAEYTYYLHLSACEDTLYVGGVQGSPGQKDEVRFLTKATYGLRPQNFLIFCLIELAKVADFSEILVINPAFHALKESERGKHIQFDYLAFWQEMGVDIHEDQPWWVLPIPYPRRPLELIKAKKRAQYRKRYELMDKVAQQIQVRWEKQVKEASCASCG